jgi:adenylate cyclase
MDKKLDRKLAAILYADVAGYSRLTGDDEEGTHHRLSHCLDLITETINNHDGNVVHYAGDAVLADFSTVSNALACAVEIQQQLRKQNADLPEDRRVEFRIGLNLGEVIMDRGDIYGDGVNVAARLESLAEPGGICISESVRTAIGKKLDLGYESMGEQQVKNITEPVRAYRVLMEPREEQKVISPEKSALELPDKPSIAVLPFDNMSGDPEQEYFSDGITEDIITELSRFSSLFVIARNSSFAFKGQSIDVKSIARELGVRYMLEGSVRRAGNRVRINAQLLDTEMATHIWAERYNGSTDDIFELQDEITRNIVGSITPQIEIAEVERGRGLRAANLTSYELSLKAQALFYDWARSGSVHKRRWI